MSDSGDQSRRDGGPRPLPRTNRPRPEHARRVADRDTPGPSGEVPVETAAQPMSGRITMKATVPLPPADAVPQAEPAPSADAAPPTEVAPSTVREAGEVLRQTPAQLLVEETALLGERPTQLDTAKSAISTDGALKQVPLVRGDSGAADAGPASTYIGCVIEGRYRIEGVLGRGGMGVVYRARHEVIDKLFAVKILLPTEDTEVVERFVNEARAATAIGNAHIVDTVDFGALPDGSTYFVMEYLEGQTLAKRLKRDGFVPVEGAIDLALQIAEGMSAAHLAGIVHRDLKPENIFLTTRDGQSDFVKLLDFGIAKIERSQNKLTRAGTIFGTPHYMSPEQASGSEVDSRADVYAVGVILYELLSGRVPFDAENPMGLLTQHMYTEPSPLGRMVDPPQVIPSAVDAVVLKCLAKKPEDRYATMTAFTEDVLRAERGETPLAMPELLARAERDDDRELVRAVKAEIRPHRRRSFLPLVVGVVTVAAGIAVVASLPKTEDAPVTPLPVVSAPAAPSVVAVPAPAGRAVALVFSPIDGEVFRDGKTLGGMPVTVHLANHEAATVEIRRDGFYPETVRIDGSRSVVVVRLTPIPGVQPRIPVPTGEPLEALRRAGDSGARSVAALLLDRHDAGAAHPTPTQTHHADGGAPHVKPPAPVVSAAPEAHSSEPAVPSAAPAPAPAPSASAASPPP